MTDKAKPKNNEIFDNLKNLMTYDDVANLLGVHRRTLYRRVKSGHLKRTFVCGKVRFEEREVAKLLGRKDENLNAKSVS